MFKTLHKTVASSCFLGNLDNRIADEGILDRSMDGESDDDDAELLGANPQVLQDAIQRRLAG